MRERHHAEGAEVARSAQSVYWCVFFAGDGHFAGKSGGCARIVSNCYVAIH
jgi:hypothetical protein